MKQKSWLTIALCLALFAPPALSESAAEKPETIPQNPEDMSPHKSSFTPEEPEDPKDPEEPVECPYKQLRGEMTGQSARGRVADARAAEVYDPDFANGCFANIRQNVVSYVQGKKGDKVYWDDAYNYWYAIHHVGGKNIKLGKQANGTYCDKTTKYHGHTVLKGGTFCTNFRVAYDSDCNIVDWDDAAEACGNLDDGLVFRFIKSSPISLIWDEGYDIDSHASIVRFELAPGSGRPWTVWKASSSSPLLVYDPEHRGEITSATQLLGDWAFGGKKTAMLTGSVNDATAVAAEPWKNGFEALASLDTDKNGKVDGAELKPLALWFDENRDGKAQPGEVRSLEDSGVTALYYTVDRKDALTGNLYVNVGYERNVNGNLVTGKTVDWYGETASGEFELAAHFRHISQAFEGLEPGVIDQPAAVSNEAKGVSNQSLDGFWQWRFVDADQNAPAGGHFVFTDGENSELVGLVINEFLLEKAPIDVKTVIHGMLVTGKKTADAEGKTQISFESTSDSARLRNTAELSTDGNELRGKTQVAYTVNNRSFRLEYNWVAERLAK